MDMVKGTEKDRPLQLAIHGMDGRSLKLMIMFLQGPCKGAAVVAEDIEADAEIIDIDAVNSKQLLDDRVSMHPDRPIIAISLQPITLEGIYFVKKPIQTAPLLQALKQIKTEINERQRKKELAEERDKLKELTPGEQDKLEFTQKDQVKAETEVKEKKRVNYEERKKTSKHKTAMLLDESGFSSFIGLVPGIDFSDRTQLISAYYNAKNYFQGYVQSAYNFSRSKGRIINLYTAWKPISIFPRSREIWVDANDSQLRSFAAIPITTLAGEGGDKLKIKAVDPKQAPVTVDLEKFQSIDTFIWKLAIWTSKGRYPQGINIHQPVYLRQWPNLTRMVITPHALRISALLMEGPRSLVNIAETLNIKYQYVFVYFSAVYALGIAGQAERRVDVIIAPPELQASEKKGLLRRIMSKLRGA